MLAVDCKFYSIGQKKLFFVQANVRLRNVEKMQIKLESKKWKRAMPFLPDSFFGWDVVKAYVAGRQEKIFTGCFNRAGESKIELSLHLFSNETFN